MKKFNQNLLPILFLPIFLGCIKDDIIDDEVPERIMIQNPVNSLKVNTEYDFKASYFDNIGREVTTEFHWKSSDTTVLEINNDGRALAKELGTANILVTELSNTFEYSFTVEVGDSTILIENKERSTMLQTTSSYILTGGTKVIPNTSGSITIEFDDDFFCDQGLPGAYIYLTNNPNTVNEAYEVAPVQVFEGANSIELTDPTITTNTYDYILFYCKPFNVKVGDGKLN